ncbi:L-arabinose isomerase [Marispirochaeta aestuarii]|uniref:L-arabinose isomerase n=1 Tax=Marispirochaeta aestuarii TaxID=1963862 RepID=A0A1Y1RVN1_9SPIO|nr:L-arabinose isomerase [Marispirochaeta aestuarii]ORC34103.1 L-arabinose isomerase [Marispirochaeta aestuarii]
MLKKDDFKQLEVWFVTGSQHLYGEETLKQVASDSRKIAAGLAEATKLPLKIVYKTLATTAEEVAKVCIEADASEKCVGLITWMHTFSPAKMWIAGLSGLKKPFVHLHTQFGRDIPWAQIDMDFMNLHQSAHGGREFGFIGSRLRIERKVIVGHWQDPEVMKKLDIWLGAALAWYDSRHMKIARFGDNMREVAVTEGDKVEAQIRFGYSVNGYGVGELVEHIQAVGDGEIASLVDEYANSYRMGPGAEKSDKVRESARIELGMRAFLEEGGFSAFTTTFEDLYGMKQLPGLAVQRLMESGYGFGAEGDWKTSALVRSLKVMALGSPGGVSFMEDYTYHLEPGKERVLGAHMLEVCSSIAADKPSLEVHPLGIGGKDDPARLVFNTNPGPAVNASIIDMGNRFRLLVNPVETVTADDDLPRLPVARVLWKPLPDLKTAAAAWIHAGGAHHTAYSPAVSVEHLEDFAAMAGIEMVLIDENTDLRSFRQELRWNEAYYGLKGL